MGKRGKKLIKDEFITDVETLTELPKADIEIERKPIKKVEPFRNLPTVNVKVYATVSGIKLDQLAGFMYYAKRNDIRRLTIPEWKKEYKKFLSLPVK